MGRDYGIYDIEFGRHSPDGNDDDNFTPNLVFVGMPFKDEMDEVYLTISEVCKSLSLNARRAGENYTGSGFVIKEITGLIEEAEFLIFDLSYERPNVYYELGFAHGVGNLAEDILLIAREGTNIHFDSMPLRVLFYKSMEHLRSVTENSLRQMMRLTRQ